MRCSSRNRRGSTSHPPTRMVDPSSVTLTTSVGKRKLSYTRYGSLQSGNIRVRTMNAIRAVFPDVAKLRLESAEAVVPILFICFSINENKNKEKHLCFLSRVRHRSCARGLFSERRSAASNWSTVSFSSGSQLPSLCLNTHET